MQFTVWTRVLQFDENTKKLTFWDMQWSPDIRKFSDMKLLFPEQKNEVIQDDEGMYFMFRWVFFSPQDRELFERNHLRYDITILIWKKVEWENNKTYWHFHPKNPEGEYYEEIYEVLEGNAWYLQQNSKKIFYTDAKQWEKVVMKTWFWHVTINAWEGYLAMANIVSSDFSSDYTVYKQNNGAGYYYISGIWQKNMQYSNIGDIEKVQEMRMWENLYDDYLYHPQSYLFLQ